MSNYYTIDPQLYDDQFWWKKDDIEFWKSICQNNKNKKILEIACGTGRIALPLIKAGLNYTGIDLSQEFVNYATQKILSYNKYSVIKQNDMRNFKHNIKYDIIFIGFNSFLHLLNEEDASQCLKCILKHMHKTTYLYIDIFVPHPLFLTRPANHQVDVIEFFDSSIKETAKIKETIIYDIETEIVDVNWYYYKSLQKKEYNQFNFKMKMYYPDTMNRMLVDLGFFIENIWGSYACDPFNGNISNLQIYQCHI